MRLSGIRRVVRFTVVLFFTLCLVLEGSLPALWGESANEGIQEAYAETNDVWDGVESIPVDHSHFIDYEFEDYVRKQFGEELTKEEALSITDIEFNEIIIDLRQLEYFPSLQTVSLGNYWAYYGADFSFLPELRYIYLASSRTDLWDDFEYDENDNSYSPYLNFTNNQELTTIELDNVEVRTVRTAPSLKYISISNCLNLKEIDVQESAVSSIDLSGAPNLEVLNVRRTSVRRLDLSCCPILKQLYCGYTNIRNLDLSHNTKLQKLECLDLENLKSLDLSANRDLTNLNVRGAGITYLDLADKTKLETFCYGNNHLVSIDLSKTAIRYYGSEWNGGWGLPYGGFYNEGDHTVSVTADENGIIDLRKIDPDFDYSKVFELQGKNITKTENGFQITGPTEGFSYCYETGLYYNFDEDFRGLYHSINEADFYLDPYPLRVSVGITNASEEPEEPEEVIPAAQYYEDVEGVVNTNGKLSFDFDENDFAKDPEIYNHTLGRASAALSLLAYNPSFYELKYTLTELMGYKNLHVWNHYMQDDTEMGLYSPYMIVHKKVMLEGEQTEIMIVVIRGTYQMEWLDDFDSGTSNIHVGFNRAKKHILEDIYTYIEDPTNEVDTNARIKILVTGHSRGAAVANLIGRQLDRGYFNCFGIHKEDVFAYTFATPNVGILGTDEKDAYNNIFNIVNPEDFVTKVMLAKWGYSRYGITYVLPSKSTESFNNDSHFKYSDYLKDIQAEYKVLNASQDYVPYATGEITLANYVNKVSLIVSNTEKYYSKNLKTGLSLTSDSASSLHNLYKYALGGNRSGNEKYEKMSYLFIGKALKGDFGYIGQETIAFFFINQILDPKFACAHMAETYYSAMNHLSKYELMQPRRLFCGKANCPVDVTIKDTEGNIVGQIINNEVVDSASADDSGVVMMVDGESKQFSLPASGDFSIEITGNDTGTMDYTLREEDADTGEIQRVYYQSVPVTPAKTFTQTIAEEPELTTIELVDETGDVVEPDAILENDGLGELSAEVTVEGNGSASSMYNLNPGDYITLRAIPDENNEFEGWYDNYGQLVSEDYEYGISMKESISLTARFREIKDPCAAGHNWELSYTEDIPATCCSEGIKSIHCSVCGAIKQDSEKPIPLKEHIYGTWKPTKAATELAKGKKVRTCLVCGFTETATIAMLKPSLKAVKITKPAAGKKSATIKWKKIAKKDLKKIKQVQIQYSLDKNFKKGVKSKYVSAKKTSLKVTGLKKGKKYYIRIRAYTKSGSKVHISKWSAKKTVKAK